MRRALVLVFWLVLTGWHARAQTDRLGPLARKLIETDSPASRQALAQFAAEEAATGSPEAAREAALAQFVLGYQDYQDKKFSSAAELLTQAASQPSDLSDYAIYYRALALAANGDHAGAAAALAGFSQRFPSSPLAASALVQRAENLSFSSQAAEAVELLLAAPHSTPASLLLLAQVAARADQEVRAAQIYQRIYYEFPTSVEQAQASEALRTLRLRLGAKYPEPPAALRLLRADRLAAAQKYLPARSEYRALSVRLKGLPREQALVRIGACDYYLHADTRAYRWLASLRLTQPEAAAERLHFMAACCRRLKRPEESDRLIAQIGEKYPQSRWYEEGLYNAAGFYFVENEPGHYIPYYRTLLNLFPRSRYAAAAQWKIAWHAYLEKSPEAASLLAEHIRRYPSSPLFTDAIYWLGRIEESRSQSSPAALANARAIYARLIADYPQHYHSLLAQERLSKLPPANDPPSPVIADLLASLPPAPARPAPEPGDWKIYDARIRLLDRLGLSDLADRELRFRADSPRFAYCAGLELAERAGERGSYHQAIRFLKHYTPGYLAFPLASMPRRYWELLFPMPWREEIENYSRQNNLDPFLVAALIRQESEFNPGAVSRAHALGLMQIMPSTGRKLGRNFGIRALPASRLYKPETSLQLGTLYLRRVLEQYDGKLEAALAGYNAGEHRADRWLGWHSLDDPAEFVESIPFAETRDYVESVLRNTEIYRKIYGD